MAVTQYIGSRYVPIFAKPIAWSNAKEYEPLTIVTHEGNSYTSKQFVPVGIDIGNDSFWALTGNYNAQVEQYRNDVHELQAEWPVYKQNMNQSLDEWKDEIVDDFTEAIENLPEEVATFKKSVGYALTENSNVVIFSDSTFQTNGDPRTGITQKSVVSFLGEITNATIDNRGVGGSDTRYLYNLLNGYTSESLSDATHIFVAYGTNDWQSSRPPIQLNTGDTYAFDYQYDACISKLCELAPQATIICVTMGYIHSTKANALANGQLFNNTCNTYETYAQVIERVASKNNCACIRLDKLLGINESNYETKMVPSGVGESQWAGIFVHYAEETNKQIAKIIASSSFEGVSGINDYSSMETLNLSTIVGVTGLDIRPRNIFRFVQCPVIHVNANENISFTYSHADGLWQDYYLTFFGNMIDVFIDNVEIARQLVGGFSIIKLPMDTASHTIKIQPYIDRVSSIDVGYLNIYMGMPNVYHLKSIPENLYIVKEKADVSNSTYYSLVKTAIFNNIIVSTIQTNTEIISFNSSGHVQENIPTPNDLPSGMQLYGIASVSENGTSWFFKPVSFRISSSNVLATNDMSLTNMSVRSLNLQGLYVR